MLTDMVAISESTPGPLGVNMATYAGFSAAGVLGSLLATFGLVLPSLVIIIIVAHYLKQFNHNKFVQAGFYGLRPAVTALIAAAGFEVLKVALFHMDIYQITHKIIDLLDFKAIILFGLLLFATNKFKKHPIIYIAMAAIIGIVFQF